MSDKGYIEITAKYVLPDGTHYGKWKLDLEDAEVRESREINPLYHVGEDRPFTLEPVPGSRRLCISGKVLED